MKTKSIKKALILSAYQTKSHKYWCNGLLKNFGQIQWQLLELPPRYFHWRIRGNGLIWAHNFESELSQNYNIVIATSMADLNSLYGFMPKLAAIPSILYFHENQFVYPMTAKSKQRIEPMIVQLYSAICASKLCFNSEYNKSSFFSGAEKLLKNLPDFVPKNLVSKLESKSVLLPVPIVDSGFYPQRNKTEKFSILWNHRWEYDKWPECFFDALIRLKQKNIDFDLYVLGQQFRKQPKVFEEMQVYFSSHIKQWGFVESEEEYRCILAKCDVVVSTALHEFQGLAVMEAVTLGCTPVVPDRLAYPQFFEENYRYPSCPENLEIQSQFLAEKLEKLFRMYENGSDLGVPDISHLSWSQQKPLYQEMMNAVVDNTF